MSLRPTVAEVDLDAVRHNVHVLRQATGVPITAVVKADGYGHGAIPVARAAVAAGVARLAVATVEEGVELRSAGLQVPILVLGWAPGEMAEIALRYGLTLTVFDAESWETAVAAAREAGIEAPVHLKLDSGMGRLGIPLWQSQDETGLLRLVRSGGLFIEGVYTHLSSADGDDAYTEEQLRRFRAAVSDLRAAGIAPRLVHAANSASALRFADSRYDTVRLGIALYGLDAFPGARDHFGLRAALRWRTRVAHIKVIAPGVGISYGHTFVPSRPMRVAVLPVGYADGYDRLLSNKGQVLIRGRRARVLGRVCMDQLIVGEVPPETRVGDEVVLVGSQGADEISAMEMAAWAGTIPYEIVTRIGSRVPRLYVNDPTA